VRVAYAHDAVVHMERDADMSILGAAVTVALCGRWEHDPPCPLAPHHSRAERFSDVVRVRILFAAEPEWEAEVRRLITAVLSGGRLVGADGEATCWQLHSSQPGTVSPEEADHAERLIRS